MSRTTATTIAFLLGASGIGVALWGGVETLAALSAFTTCTTPVILSTNAFWFLGCISWVCIPLFTLSRNERYHKALVIALVVAFVAPPIGTFLVLDHAKDDSGYVVASGSWSLFNLNLVELEALTCAP